MATLLRCLHRPDVLGVEQGRKVFSWPTAPPRQQSHPERQYPELAARDNWGWSVAENFVLLFQAQNRHMES